MNDPHRPPPAASCEALLRYTVLAQVEALQLGGWALSEAVREVARRKHAHLDGRPVHISVRTLQRWRAAYLQGNLVALEPGSRTRTETSLTLSEGLSEFLRTEKQRDPRASVPEVLRRAEQQGIIGCALAVDRTTVWRACRRMDLPTRARPSKREGDMRRWRYPQRMQCVLADGKHFRAGLQRLRRVALFFLDDATRYGLHAVVGTSESTLLFLLGLYEMVSKHGLAELLYLDRGPGFISADTLEVVQGALGAWLIHGRAKYPQGHGALERFHRTAGEQLLRSLDGALEVDPACEALTLRLRHFLERYNDTPHETLDGDTPRQRWEAGRPLRFPEDQTPSCTAASSCAKTARSPATTSSSSTDGSGRPHAAWETAGCRSPGTCWMGGCGSCTRGAGSSWRSWTRTPTPPSAAAALPTNSPWPPRVSRAPRPPSPSSATCAHWSAPMGAFTTNTTRRMTQECGSEPLGVPQDPLHPRALRCGALGAALPGAGR